MDEFECINCSQKFKRNYSLEKHLQYSSECSKVTIKLLTLEIKGERFKVRLLKELIRTHTTFPIDELFKDLDTGINIYDYNKGDIPVIVNTVLKGKDKQIVYSTAKKEIYKSVTHFVRGKDESEPSSEEPASGSQERSTLASEASKARSVVVQTMERPSRPKGESKVLCSARTTTEVKIDSNTSSHNSDKTPREEKTEQSEFQEKLSDDTQLCNTESLAGLLEQLKTEKKVTVKILTNIQKELQNGLNANVFYKTYLLFVKECLTTIRKTVKDKRILKTLSVTTARFLYFNNCISYFDYDTSIEIEYINQIKNKLYPIANFSPFDKDKLLTPIKNYSLALFPVLTLVKLFPKGNIAYFPYKKSSDEDPYSFYVLTKSEKKSVVPDPKDLLAGSKPAPKQELVEHSRQKGVEKFRPKGIVNYWRMDCRLEELSRDIADDLRITCIKIFRKIYFDVFKDNRYRKDYEQHSPILKEECTQLLMNIRTLARYNSFRKELVRIIFEDCTINPTEDDKCALAGDDHIQRKRLLMDKDSDEELIISTKELFDDVENNFNVL